MEDWDQDRRNKVFANRKQQWQADKQRLEEPHHGIGTRFIGNHMEGSSPMGIERVGAARSAHHFGSSTLTTKGPEAAGGPVPPEPPSASGGGDLGGRAAPLGRLVQGVGRQGGPPEPLAAPTVTGTRQGLIGSFSVSTADPALRAGELTPALSQTFPGAGHPGRATGRSALNPD